MPVTTATERHAAAGTAKARKVARGPGALPGFLATSNPRPRQRTAPPQVRVAARWAPSASRREGLNAPEAACPREAVARQVTVAPTTHRVLLRRDGCRAAARTRTSRPRKRHPQRTP